MICVEVEVRRGAFSLTAAFRSDARLVGLFGRSGSGKTTLIHVIAGLIRPQRGQIEIDGHTLFDSGRGFDLAPRRRRVGLVYQDSLLFPHLSVRQNLLFGRFFTPKAERRVPYGSVIETLGIAGLLERRPGTLSGGERQRVALARALLASPRILLMDEPLASLDADRKGEIIGLIERLRDEYRIPIIYVSHAVEEVSRLAGYVVVLEGGQVVATGTPADAFSEMNRAAVADRFGMISIIECEVAGFDSDFEITTLNHPAGAIMIAGSAGAPGKAVRVLVHATDIALATSRPSNVSVRTVLAGTVGAIRSEEGPLCFVEIALHGGGRITASVTRLAISELAVAPGVQIFALIKAVAIDERPFHSR